LHACALVVGERGALIRGPSGAGKSTLALAILARARASGSFAALVADDRVFLTVASSRLLARGAPGFEGVIERRGEGLLEEVYEPRAVVHLVVDLCDLGKAPPRWPEEAERHVELMGVTLPRLALDSRPGPQEGAYAALQRLARVE
jgi:serine kinase of HPr protein (carbohydrate metabolism regulator)